MSAYAELHCHTNFSFLDGASAPDELAERAVELGLSGLAVTDHQGLYGIVRSSAAFEEAGLRPVVGIEIELRDPIVADPDRVVVPARRLVRRGRRRTAGGETLGGGAAAEASNAAEGRPDRPRPDHPPHAQRV